MNTIDIDFSKNPGVRYLERPGKSRLAYVYTESTPSGKKLPLVMFCGGYRSDMMGTKALYLEQQARARGQAYLRFDYSGHGLSGGVFDDCTLGDWKNDALDVLNHVCPGGPVVLVGSSMGGWIALLIATQWKGALAGLIGIAAAPDFTEWIYKDLTPQQKSDLEHKGRVEVPNDYSDTPYAFTRRLYEEGKSHLMLDKIWRIDAPVRLIQGMQDRDVPWETAVRIQKALVGEDIDVVFVEDGDHRLSKPADLELIDREIRVICGVKP